MRSQFFLVSLPVGIAILLAASWLTIGGSLTPPGGPVTPTMKRLDQVEPRIAINATNTPGDADSVYRITQPGSYYLTGHVVGAVGRRGIEIAFSGVSIDLMGYTVRGVPGSLEGIATDGGTYDNLTVRNGTVSQWGGDGINLALGTGLGSGSLVEKILATENAGLGVYCNRLGIIVQSGAYANGGYGFAGGAGGMILNCTSYENVGDGFRVGSGGAIRSCVASRNDGNGIDSSLFGCSVIHCTLDDNGLDGILAGRHAHVRENNCTSNGTGIHVLSTYTAVRIEGNNVTNNDRGIHVEGSGNLIIRNSASDNTTANYDIVAGNTVGPTVTSVTIAGNSNPHANYEF